MLGASGGELFSLEKKKVIFLRECCCMMPNCFGLSFEGLQSSADITVAAAFNAPKLQVIFSINREKSLKLN